MSDMGRDFDFRGPFLLPGTTLFSDFCAAVVDRYGLRDIVRKGKVSAPVPLVVDGTPIHRCVCTVHTWSVTGVMVTAGGIPATAMLPDVCLKQQKQHEGPKSLRSHIA